MAVYKQKKSRFWWVSVYDGNGERRRVSTGTENLEVAKEIERSMKQGRAHSIPIDKLHAMLDLLAGSRSGLPLDEAWQSFEDYAAKQKMPPKKFNARRQAFSLFREWLAKNCKESLGDIGIIRKTEQRAFVDWLSAGRTGKTCRNIVGQLSSLWRTFSALNDAKFENNWGLFLPKDDSIRLEAFSREQERAILEQCRVFGHGWYAISLISRFTGLRYGDIACLKWESVDLDGKLIRIRPSKTSAHGIDVIAPLIDRVVAALPPKEGDYVFPEHQREYPHPPRVGTFPPFSQILNAAGVDGRFTFHSWRHTFRTRLAEAGVSDEIAKRLGGWTEDSTARRYDHDGRVDDLRAAVLASAGEGGPCASRKG